MDKLLTTKGTKNTKMIDLFRVFRAFRGLQNDFKMVASSF